MLWKKCIEKREIIFVIIFFDIEITSQFQQEK